MIALTLADLVGILDARLVLAPGATEETVVDGAVETNTKDLLPGGVFVALPGEIFAATAHEIRDRLRDPDAMVIGLSEGCPGYIAPREEYAAGGYEIDEAHRYYGMPAAFAPGAAEALVEAVALLDAGARDPATEEEAT